MTDFLERILAASAPFFIEIVGTRELCYEQRDLGSAYRWQSNLN